MLNDHGHDLLGAVPPLSPEPVPTLTLDRLYALYVPQRRLFILRCCTRSGLPEAGENYE